MIKSRCFLTLSEVSGSRENETESAAAERKREKGGGGRDRERELREGGGLPNLRQTERKREMRREVGDSERESHARRERKGERRREPRVCRGAVCDEPEGPVRDHPNSEDPLFSRCPVPGARSVYAEVAESGGAGGGAEQTVVGQERVRRRGRAPTPLEILNCR